jgi:hypothetical protein
LLHLLSCGLVGVMTETDISSVKDRLIMCIKNQGIAEKLIEKPGFPLPYFFFIRIVVAG